ncbi:hypothetical protein SAMN02799622_03513 [Methylobacterium sp. UNC378MF]|uniref:hypothetical protein n=1 Tax=Methylobacterium sp. UNC378MF TaxID=1502748 RepID=UPI00087F1DB8|nr:hypothetical protein [Methylobacterium sp. UNC378MF]SDA24927.1 hypothetical protein SAMN02799622_03513 [Methylobacterium sp. UNC378MF]
MSDDLQKVPIERVNWVRWDGSELVVSLVTMGRSLAFGFKPEAAHSLFEGIVKTLREQADEAIPANTAGSDEPAAG